MYKFAVAALVLVGCWSPDPAPKTDEEIVELAVESWPSLSPECASVAHAPITYDASCGAFEACVRPGRLEIRMTRQVRTDSERVRLLVHETAHLLLECEGASGDPDHVRAEVWRGWVPEVARALDY